MATVKAIARTTRKGVEINIRFRLSDGRNVQLFHNSEIRVNADLWDAKNDCIKKRSICPNSYRNSINKAVNDRKSLLLDLYSNNKKLLLNGTGLDELVDRAMNPEKYQSIPNDLFELIDVYIEANNRADNTKRADRNLKATLLRYEVFRSLTSGGNFKLDVSSFDAELLDDMKSFYMNEGDLYTEYPSVFAQLQKACNLDRSIKNKGENVTCSFMKRLKAFFSWCAKENIIPVSPFTGYENNLTQRYGTPYYLTLEERNIIADYDFGEDKRLSVQRDIFIFQCCIGCRVSDLLRLTKKNIINGAVEYIPTKTKGKHSQTVRVPLNKRAMELVNKYATDSPYKPLFPYLSMIGYNRVIKDILRVSGITRMVTVLNPTTGEEEQRPINEIASSHIARRTFVGNLYKKVKDPNLVGALSGHAEGSKAFARYREIDEELKKEVVSLID